MKSVGKVEGEVNPKIVKDIDALINVPSILMVLLEGVVQVAENKIL